MYGNDVRRTLILGQYGTAVRSERNCSENTNVYGVRPITNVRKTLTQADRQTERQIEDRNTFQLSYQNKCC